MNARGVWRQEHARFLDLVHEFNELSIDRGHTTDALSGTHMSYNAMFGYSATAGGRFAGFGNSAFGFAVTAAIVRPISASLLELDPP